MCEGDIYYYHLRVHEARIGLNQGLPKNQLTFQPQLSQSEVNAIINTHGDLLDKDEWWFSTLFMIQGTKTTRVRRLRKCSRQSRSHASNLLLLVMIAIHR